MSQGRASFRRRRRRRRWRVHGRVRMTAALGVRVRVRVRARPRAPWHDRYLIATPCPTQRVTVARHRGGMRQQVSGAGRRGQCGLRVRRRWRWRLRGELQRTLLGANAGEAGSELLVPEIESSRHRVHVGGLGGKLLHARRYLLRGFQEHSLVLCGGDISGGAGGMEPCLAVVEVVVALLARMLALLTRLLPLPQLPLLHVELSLVLMGSRDGVVVLALQPRQVRNGRVHLVLPPVKLLQHALRVLDACKANVRPRLHLRHRSLASFKLGLDARHAGTRCLHLLPPPGVPLRRRRKH